jgi:ribosomal protein L23
MYAITEKAQKLTYKSKKGQWTVTIRADGDKTSVKAPSPEVFKRIISIIRTILHLEDDNASMVLSLGLRGGQVDIQVKVERGESKEALRFKFPDLG